MAKPANFKVLSPLQQAQKRRFMRLSYNLWQSGAEDMHEQYPEVSIQEFRQANDYFDSLRCEGCSCGTCIELPILAANLDNIPEPLSPLARLAKMLAKKDIG